jgi:NADH-quinone oxidoreductase subunit G
MNQNGSHYVDGLMNGLNIDTSSRGNYLFNTGIANIERADAILLVGTFPRHEAAMVNARIRKAYSANNRLKIAVIGANNDFNYPVMSVGSSPEDLKNIKSHKFGEILKSAKFPMMIIGAGVFMRNDGVAIQKLCHDIAREFNFIRDNWNGFNVLHLFAAQVGALDLGLTHSGDLSSQEFVYLMNVDADLNINKNAFVIYQGHHGDKGAARADVILPSAAYTEKDGLYVNTEGRVQLGKRAIAPVGDAREDWKILRALSSLIGDALPFDTLYQLRTVLTKAYPHFAEIDQLPKTSWGAFGRDGTISNDSFTPAVTNFYNTNVITNASKIMQECTTQFGAQSSQQHEAAE